MLLGARNGALILVLLLCHHYGRRCDPSPLALPNLLNMAFWDRVKLPFLGSGKTIVTVGLAPLTFSSTDLAKVWNTADRAVCTV